MDWYVTNGYQWPDMSPMFTNGLTCHQCLPMDWHDFRIGVWNTKAKCWTEEQILNWLLDSWIKASLWVFICTKNIQNRLRNGWVMAIFPLRGCVIPLRTTWDKRGSLGVHLYQKDPKSVQKWLIYCYFSTERLSYGFLPTERLRNSIENYMEQKSSFVYI